MFTFVTSCIIWKSSRDDKRCDKETHMSSYPKWLYPNLGFGGKINKIFKNKHYVGESHIK